MAKLAQCVKSSTLAAALLSGSSMAYAATQPNILMIVVDDFGYGDSGAYGGGEGRGMPTPNIDALAADGLQFTNFHVTPVCSPTRASLLTGRSQHAVGMRMVSNFRTGFPHMLGHITNHAATVAGGEVAGDVVAGVERIAAVAFGVPVVQEHGGAGLSADGCRQPNLPAL